MTSSLWEKRVRIALLGTIGPGFMTWKAIMIGVDDAGIKVNNWLDVRDVLQGLIDGGSIEREESIVREAYRST